MDNRNRLQNFESIGIALKKCISRINCLRKVNNGINGVPSGFIDLDRITHGWQAADLIVVAAPPWVGKTAFAVNLVLNALRQDPRPIAVGFFSLDLSSSQLTQRILSAASEVFLEKITRGKLEEQEYHQIYCRAVKRLENALLFIDDSGALTVFDLRKRIRGLVDSQNVGLIVIDSLQFIVGTSRNNNHPKEVNLIMKHLKALARELKIPIIILSQLDSSINKRKESKMPQLNDLRKLGPVEQHADTVIFIYRPEYYEIPINSIGQSTKGETHIRIAKHRNGYLDIIKLKANLQIQKFYNWENLYDF